MVVTDYSDIKKDIVQCICEKGDDEEIIINVRLAPWASVEEFNDMELFCGIYSSQKSVTIKVSRQSWLEFIKSLMD